MPHQSKSKVIRKMTEESISTREGPEDCKVQDGEEVEQQGHRIAAEETPQYAFYTKFLATQAELSQRIAGLATLAPAARNEQIQDLLREIAELNEEIHDARSFLPGYDLRSYSEVCVCVFPQRPSHFL